MFLSKHHCPLFPHLSEKGRRLVEPAIVVTTQCNFPLQGYPAGIISWNQIRTQDMACMGKISLSYGHIPVLVIWKDLFQMHGGSEHPLSK